LPQNCFCSNDYRHHVNHPTAAIFEDQASFAGKIGGIQVNHAELEAQHQLKPKSDNASFQIMDKVNYLGFSTAGVYVFHNLRQEIAIQIVSSNTSRQLFPLLNINKIQNFNADVSAYSSARS
jgi:hypothetical protein